MTLTDYACVYQSPANGDQGKSLSLICASLTWLRNHKSSMHETALKEAGSEYRDEPSWIVEQLLRQKREELVRKWEDREKRLEAVRLKEKAQEERVRKRRRIEEAGLQSHKVDDEEAEFLLNDGDEGFGGQESTSGLSKKTQDLLNELGFGKAKRTTDEDDDALEEPIKVRKAERGARRGS